MIVIPRAKGQAVRIGDDVVVTVVEIRGDSVRLSIERPGDDDFHDGETRPGTRAYYRDVLLEPSVRC